MLLVVLDWCVFVSGGALLVREKYLASDVQRDTTREHYGEGTWESIGPSWAKAVLELRVHSNSGSRSVGATSKAFFFVHQGGREGRTLPTPPAVVVVVWYWWSGCLCGPLE